MSILDLNGKVIFKIKLGNEIKKFVNHNDELTYNELCVMIQRIFSEKITKNDEFSLKYTDEDNDSVTIENDNDVLLAIQTNKVLRLTIYLKNDDVGGLNEKFDAKSVNPTEIVKELQTIRSSIDKFLEKFEYLIKLQENDNQQKQTKTKPTVNDTKSTNSIEAKLPNLNIIETHKEFDPLANKKTSRAETPDSVSSLTSSPSQRKLNSFQDSLQQQQQQDASKQQQPQHQQYYNQAVMNSFQANLDGAQQSKLNNLIPAAFIPPPTPQQQQQQLQSQMLQQQQQQQPQVQQPPQQQQQQLPIQQNSYQANTYQGFPQQQQPQQAAAVQAQYATQPQTQLAQQQQALLTEQQQQQQYLQYMQQQQLQQQQQALQQQAQNQNYQQQMQQQSNPYAKPSALTQNRYPTPTNFQQAYK